MQPFLEGMAVPFPAAGFHADCRTHGVRALHVGLLAAEAHTQASRWPTKMRGRELMLVRPQAKRQPPGRAATTAVERLHFRLQRRPAASPRGRTDIARPARR